MKSYKKIALAMSISSVLLFTVACQKVDNKGELNTSQTVAANRIKPIIKYRVKDDLEKRSLEFYDRELENKAYEIKDELYKYLMEDYIDQGFGYELVLGDIIVEFDMENILDELGKDIYFRLKSNRIAESQDDGIPINNDKTSENYGKKQTDGYVKKDSKLGKEIISLMKEIVNNNETSLEEIISKTEKTN